MVAPGQGNRHPSSAPMMSRYDGVLRHEFYSPTFVYLAWGAQAEFVVPPPAYANNQTFDPFTVCVSAGIGQLWQNFLISPDMAVVAKDREQNTLEWCLGVRGQKTWGDDLLPPQGNFQIGPEAYLLYEHQLSADLRFFVQYEGHGEFKDLKHVINLVTAEIKAQLNKYLAVDLAFRAYYETRPKEVATDFPGYNQWGVVENVLVGLIYTF
jgi:hypothetical protein